MPIEIRSVEYFGLGISHSKGKLANQIWLLAEDLDSVLHGKTFARYILKDEITGKEHPTASGIMYVSLIKLSQEDSSAGELAAFLLGKKADPTNEIVKKVAKAFNSSFEAFKADKEAVKVLSARERGWHEGLAEGREEGTVKGVSIGANKLAELIRSGLSVDEALLQVNEAQYELAEAQ